MQELLVHLCLCVSVNIFAHHKYTDIVFRLLHFKAITYIYVYTHVQQNITGYCNLDYKET